MKKRRNKANVYKKRERNAEKELQNEDLRILKAVKFRFVRPTQYHDDKSVYKRKGRRMDFDLSFE